MGCLSVLVALGGCTDVEGPAGLPGQNGVNGGDGKDGVDGTDGTDGTEGRGGPQGPEGPTGPAGEGPKPLASNLADYVKVRVHEYATGTLPDGFQLPLQNALTDSLRTLSGLKAQVVIRWLDPLSLSTSSTAPRFGANPDYVAYFGDDWNKTPGDAPQWNGSDDSAWLWVNHESVSGNPPRLNGAPNAQHLTLAKALVKSGILTNDVTQAVWSQTNINTYITQWKKQVGGTWMHVVRDPSSGEWALDLSQTARRYDATSSTLFHLTGTALLSGVDHTDSGSPLAAGVTVGTLGNCSGAQTPWGTVISGEENTAFAYGEIEPCWSADQKFLVGVGFDSGAMVSPPVGPSSGGEFWQSGNPNAAHGRDTVGYLTEFDPGVSASEYEGKVTAGVGHKKLGAVGHARWENATFARGKAEQLLPGQPIVFYSGEDRRSGRVYKWVSDGKFTEGMTKTQIRGLLDSGRLYAAHFEGLDNKTGNTLLSTSLAPTESAPGTGKWIHLSVTSSDAAPNAVASGNPNLTVGQALASPTHNGMGGFADDDAVYRTLFTASNKVGIMELNRPEDVEYNPNDSSGTPRIYVSFTNHNRKVALDQTGKLFDPATQASQSPTRSDTLGEIFAIQEGMPDAPAESLSFSYFEVWHGKKGKGDFDAANPDNLMIDREGGVWFCTDGTFGVSGVADGLYYLDLNPAHKQGPAEVVAPTYGLAFRVAAVPSDAEATGPAFSANMNTLFFSVQHPGVTATSDWPDGDDALPALVALNFAP